MKLTAAQHTALQALCRRMVPLPDVPDASAAELARAVEARLGGIDPEQAALVARLLTVVDHPVTAAVTRGIPVRFSRMDAARQDAWLAGWETSRIPARRTIFQALRRLILSTFYADPAAYGGIGYAGPLHDRIPTFPGEGPAAGTSVDDEPIAREPSPERRVISISPRSLEIAGEPWLRQVTDGARMGMDTRVRADVCVVGTGAGGAVAAARLAEAGFDVAIVEEGGWLRGEDFTEQEGPMTEALYAEKGGRATDDLAIPMLQGRCVGGGTTVNWMIMLRARDAVLDEWADEHGTVGMRASDLARVFARVEAETHTRT